MPMLRSTTAGMTNIQCILASELAALQQCLGESKRRGLEVGVDTGRFAVPNEVRWNMMSTALPV